MANVSPYGIKPIINQYESVQINPYYIPANLAYALTAGTPVVLTVGSSNPNSTINSMSYPVGTLPAIARATGGDGNKLLGTIVGFGLRPTDILGNNITNPANTENVAWVADFVGQEFSGVMNGVLNLADLGKNFNLTIGTVNTFMDRDSTSINITPSASATAQIRVKEVSNSPLNSATVTGPEVVFSINNHSYSPNT